MKTWLIAAIVLTPTLAQADECLDRAIQHVAGRDIVAFCEPCGDKVPGIPMLANGNVIDPAHTYVRVAPDRFANVALLVGCAVEPGVSPSLAVEVETAAGVLITASDRWVTPDVTTPPPAVTTTPTPAVATSPPPPTSTNHYYTTVVSHAPWLAIAALAGGLGIGLGVAMTLGALAVVRRRRAMEPRAAKLARRRVTT